MVLFVVSGHVIVKLADPKQTRAKEVVGKGELIGSKVKQKRGDNRRINLTDGKNCKLQGLGTDTQEQGKEDMEQTNKATKHYRTCEPN